MIRISSQQIFSGGINRLQDLSAQLNKTDEQIATGKRVNRPSDDPVAAARILKLDQEVKRIETYERNAQLANNRLGQEESAISSSLDILQRVRELTVQAGNGSLSANDRLSISSEMKERLQQLAQTANTQDASGEYIFSGFQGGSPAYAKEAGEWTYQGDEGQRMLEIDDGVTVAISDNGKGIFDRIPATASGALNVPIPLPVPAPDGRINSISVINRSDLQAGGLASLELTVSAPNQLQYLDKDGVTQSVAFEPGEPVTVNGVQFTLTDAVLNDVFTIETGEKQSVFKTIENLISGLDNLSKSGSAGSDAYNDLIAGSLANIDNAQESFILKQTELGGRMNSVESTQAFLEDSALYSKEIRSQLQDIDYAEAISTLSFQSFVLQAAQQSFARVSQLSLFDRL
ncbi:flagellar hook-associated protein FlgL [Marinobacter sp. BSs20148]|jgi:flagellar hook-associated protein 3 FlgL|uniref:flagellar hook-associated protein FlgL n=1 Tax=Marinobacter TaxID=2742 RepID=UPI0002776E40|nr:flagellar hook-associated protein FlgL [Marinobacter sp. BSs20148]AFP30600.1 Flagellar hook-associated protein 3 [Marinobacter sp. BSs20148]